MWRDCWIVLLSRPARALWIEMSVLKESDWGEIKSRPARALWIEIVYSDGQCTGSKVEAREGLVD